MSRFTFLFFKMYRNMHHFAFSIRKLQNYHFLHTNKGHNSMCIELIFKKFAGQMQMIIINLFASFNAYKIFHIYFLLIKNHFFDLWPWNFYMTPWGDFGGIFFENAPDPKLALSKGFILLPEMSHQNLRWLDYTDTDICYTFTGTFLVIKPGV